jgi:transketolase
MIHYATSDQKALYTLSNAAALQGELRLRLLQMYNSANAGHVGCSLSCIDLLIAILFFSKKTEDTLILSKGHAAAALYACLHYLGELSDDTLASFYQEGTTLPAHPAPGKFKGIPFATGSLGHGFPIGCGVAHATKLQRGQGRTFVLMSDGETNEGTTWEAAHFALQHRLDNLVVIVDKNGLQGFGQTAEVLGDTASRRTWEAMGFEVWEVNGHDIPQLVEILANTASAHNGKPKLVIANTVKGKGISYMENKLEWHYLPMNGSQYEQAVSEIRSAYPLHS